MYQDQPYLWIMYNALFVTTYFGLFRVGEVTSGTHPIKAHDVQIAGNKSKLRFILRSSMMHGPYNKPQIITIVSTMSSMTKKATARNSKSSSQWSDICPFAIIQKFINIRKSYKSLDEPFFIFRDRSQVTPSHMRLTFQSCLKSLQLNYKNYRLHGIRAGRALDLLNMGVSVETIKQLGRWKSNAVYAYLQKI